MRLAALLLSTLLCCSLFAAERPNFVVILCDDLGIGDLKAYNPESKIDTPALNKLAGQGARFTDMHTPSSVCTPTRYGLLTGRYCWRSKLKSGVLNGRSPLLIESGRETIASLLKKRGYATAGIGKWHLGLGTQAKTDYSKPFDAGPLSVGFDSYFGIPASLDMEPYVWVNGATIEAQPTEKTAGGKHQREGGDGFYRAGEIAPGFTVEGVLPRMTEKACEFLKQRAQKKEEPFFLYLPLASPHTPWVPTAEWKGKSSIGAYGDFVMQTDHAIGQIVDTLDTLGFGPDTVVIVTSDNGSHWPEDDITKTGHRSNHNLRGQKADIHEAGHRVPFLVRWPGRIPEGAAIPSAACLTDLFATVAELTGEPLTDGTPVAEDSFSFMRLFAEKNETLEVRSEVIHHSADGMFAIRVGDWKYCEALGSGGFTAPKRPKAQPGEANAQLYNLKDDPAEKDNVALKFPEKAAELKKKLEAVKAGSRTRP